MATRLLRLPAVLQRTDSPDRRCTSGCRPQIPTAPSEGDVADRADSTVPGDSAACDPQWRTSIMRPVRAAQPDHRLMPDAAVLELAPQQDKALAPATAAGLRRVKTRGSPKAIERLLRVHMPLVSRHAVPPGGFQAITTHAATGRVHEAEVVLPAVVSLFGGASVPVDGFGVVPLDPAPGLVHEAEVDLPLGVSLFGGASEPADGFGVVPLDPAPGLVHEAEVVLWVNSGRPRVHTLCASGAPAVLRRAQRCRSTDAPGRGYRSRERIKGENRATSTT